MARNTRSEQELALATQYFRSGRAEMAEALLRPLLGREPDLAPAYELLAYILGNRGDTMACEQMLTKASSLPGCSAEAWFYLGKARLQRHDARAAVGAFDSAIRMAGPFFEALHEMGVAHSALGEHPRAIECWMAAAPMRPGSHELHFNIGRSLEELHRFDEALKHYDKALQIDSTLAHVWANRGVTLTELGRSAEALASHERALALQPEDAKTWINKAVTLTGLQRHAQALACLHEAWRRAPETDYLQGMRLHTKMQMCQWDGLAQAFDELSARIQRGEKASTPFPMVAVPADQATLLACARTYAHDKHPAQPAPAFTSPPADRKIRIGYFSADFHLHATAHLMAGLFECHDRQRFETYAFAFGPQVRDAMRERLVAAFDHFVEVSDCSDADIAAKARAAGLDIAVDLKGFTQDCRPGIFAHRAAPLQVNYLGFPGTMGLECIDYVVADDTLIRPDEFCNYAEKVLLLPDSYQVNDNTRPIAAQAPSRSSLGLPEQGFVFATFNNSYKITPDVFDVWMRLLLRVPGSVLWLLRSSAEAATRLQEEARMRGVDDARLVWAERMDLPQHLARHACADLFLDTVHCNAHTTCSDALWAGLPVLTLAGHRFASRVSASLLKAAGLPELITHDLAAYEDLALTLASSPQQLHALRERLARNRLECPLFDTSLFARRLEAGFKAMLERHRRGLAPDHIRVTDQMTTLH
ncbi:MAG TPA: tetratricopeptide repeat protein [Variovorax sp.]|nr:tetratricopeptide repeat protein [Variovorax sp.]